MAQSKGNIKDAIEVADEALKNLMPYRRYDKEREVHINQGSVMKIMELAMLSGANQKLIEDLVACVNKNLNESVFFRIFRITHRKIALQLKTIIQQYAQKGGVFGELAKKQEDYLLYATYNGFPNNLNLATPLFDSRIFCEITLPCTRSNEKAKIEKLMHLDSQLKIDFKTSDIKFVSIDASGLLSIVRSFLAYKDKDITYDYSYNNTEYVNEQITTPGQSYIIEADGVLQEIEHEYSKVSVYSIKKFPDQFALWNAGDYIASIGSNAGVTTPHIFSITFRLMSDVEAKSKANKKFSDLAKKVHSPLGNLFPSLKYQYQEWTKIRDELERDVIKIADAHIAIAIISDVEKHSFECSRFEKTMQTAGFEVIKNENIQLPLYLSCFPGVLAEGYWDDFKRAGLIRKFTTWNLVNLLPIVGDWKGSRGGFVAPGIRNQLCAIDYFSEEIATDNKNIAIAAGSGAGKSVFTQTLLYQVLSTNGIVFIIDKGESYKKLCQMLNGVYIDGKDLRLNPFTYLDQIKDVEDLKASFALVRDLLVTLVSPNKELDEVSRALLLEASYYAYEKEGKGTNIDSVMRALEEIQARDFEKSGHRDIRIADLVTLLTRYSTTGIYNKYFNESSPISPTAKFVVLELGGLDSNEDLLRAVLFSLINTISQRMYLSDRSVRKICIIDEAWSLLSGDNARAAKFIENGFRTSRKYGGSFVTITQGIKDYFKDSCALACWDNSDIKIIMRQNEGALKKFVEDHPNQITEYERHVLSQFRPASESGFSSFMFKAGSLTTFHRLFLDPHTRVMFSTHPKQHQMVVDQMKSGKNIWEGIDYTTRHFYPDELQKIETFAHQLNSQEGKDVAI